MGNKKVLVVEDEVAIAEEIIDRLEGMGFKVPAAVSSGEDAVKKAGEVRPDLVLMDIKLGGEMDGIEAAERIHAKFGIPVIYLTAHSDGATLERAKITEPFGYITKPFDDKDLMVGVEIALYKHEMEAELKRYQENLEEMVEERTAEIMELKELNESIVQGMQSGIVVENADGVVTFANPRMLEMLGASKRDLVGRGTRELFPPEFGRKAREADLQAEKGGKARYEAALALGDRELDVIVNVTPRMEHGSYAGSLKEFIDITERKEAEEKLRKKALKYKIEGGRSYLVTEKALERGADAFNDLLGTGYSGMAISRTPPKELKEKIGNEAKILWFSEEKSGKEVIPSQLDVVAKSIEDFVCAGSVILLDRLDYLIVQNSFNDVLKFVNKINETVYASRAVLLIVVDPDTLSKQDLALLEKETLKVEAKHQVHLETDLIDVLEFIKAKNDEGRSPVHMDVMKAFGITRPTVTKKLKELKSRGLLVEKKWGRYKTLILTERGKEVL